MQKVINAMAKDEVTFLPYSVELTKGTILHEPEALLKFATTTENQTFIHNLIVYEDGLTILCDSSVPTVWSNRKPHVFTDENGAQIITFPDHE